MQGIDDPEMPGHFRPGRRCTAGDPFASTENLRRLVGGSAPVRCQRIDVDHYGRTVARCSVGELDLRAFSYFW
jgi:endonuclease YncB( thermonuclease family)